MSIDNAATPGGPMSGLVASAVEYMVDAGQRSVLFLDVMRRRGDQYREHVAQTAPHVLQYAAELIIDGRKLDEPVNYALVRIIPPKDVEIDLDRRPFVIVDPRAGHGPGIGGFKADSEIGVAMKAGHPCYFIGFLPEPMPGQTIERIARAEALFIEKVISRHPEADGKPCVIGNCQAGWAVMILASLRPELFGPLIIAGAPLAYWAGVQGKYPMRYSGGLLGGSWLTALTSDLGAGKFDGAWLVQNFENQNPSNTLWTKQYNVYSKVDTEADALPRIRALVGRTRQPECRGNPVHRRRTLRRQQPRRRPDQDVRRADGRSAQYQIADRGVLLQGRQHHATAAGAATGSSISTPMSTKSGPMVRRSSTRFTKTSAISASSFPAASPRRSMRNSPATSI